MGLISRRLFENLPLYVRMADELTVLEHLCDTGLQPELNRIFKLLRDREFSLDVTHPYTEGYRDYLGQWVGLGAINDLWLGIGLNPRWSPGEKLETILAAFQYWQIKGTDEGIKTAIAMWLKYKEPITLRRPFGKTEPFAQWFDYLTPYDAHIYKPLAEQRYLGGGDYLDTEMQPDWFRLVSDRWQWDYLEVWGTTLRQEAAPIVKTRGSGLGPRNLEKHFDLTPDTWNNVFPNVHELDIETLPALTRSRNFAWLNITGVTDNRLKLRLKPKQDLVTTRIEQEWEIDGFKYEDYFPILPKPAESEIIETVIDGEYGNYLEAFQWNDLWGRLDPIPIPAENRIEEITVLLESSYPYAQWGDVPGNLASGVSVTPKILKEVLIEGNPGWEWGEWWSSNSAIVSYATTTETFDSNYPRAAEWGDLWGESYPYLYDGYEVQTTSTTETPSSTGLAPFYSPTQWVWREFDSQTEDLSQPQTGELLPRYPAVYPVYFPQEIRRERGNPIIEFSNYPDCFQWESTLDPPLSTPDNPQYKQVVTEGTYPGWQWGDSYPQTEIDGQLTTIDGNYEDAFRWNEDWGSRLWYYAQASETRYEVRTYPVYKTSEELWLDTYDGAVWEEQITWGSQGLETAAAWQFDVWGELHPWYSDPEITVTLINPDRFGGMVPFYSPTRETLVEVISDVEPPSALNYIASLWGELLPWYYPDSSRPGFIEIEVLPEYRTGGYSFYAPDRAEIIRQVDTTLATEIPPIPFERQWLRSLHQYSYSEYTELPPPPPSCDWGWPSQLVNTEVEEVTTPGDREYSDVEWQETTVEIRQTEIKQAGIYPGAAWGDIWISIDPIIWDYEQQETITPGVEPPQAFELIAASSTLIAETVEWDGNYPGITYFETWFSIAPETHLDAIEVDFFLDWTLTSFTFNYPDLDPPNILKPTAGGMNLEPSQYWYYPATKTVSREVIETPEQWRMVDPIAISTYFDLWGESASYLYEGRSETSVTEITLVYQRQIIEPHNSFYLPEIDEVETTEIVIPAHWKFEDRWVMANYFNVWGEQPPYWYVAPPTTQITTTTETRDIVYCHISDRYTMYDIDWLIETEVEERQVVSSIQEFYPDWNILRQSQNWRIALELSNGLLLQSPQNLIWINQEGDRSVVFDSDSFNNLHMEFLITPHTNDAIHSIMLLLDNKLVYGDNFNPSLKIHKETLCGFKFTIPITFDIVRA